MHIDLTAESNFRFGDIIDNVENSLTEVINATSIAEEIHEILIVHANFTFMVQREVALADHLQTVSANIASTEFVNVSSANQSIEELASHLNYQVVQLKKMADSLQSVIQKSSTLSAVEESLRMVKVL